MVQGSVDVMHFKLRQMLDTTIYEMRFARTNSQFRLQCGYKPGKEYEDIAGRERRSVDISTEHLGLLLL